MAELYENWVEQNLSQIPSMNVQLDPNDNKKNFKIIYNTLNGIADSHFRLIFCDILKDFILDRL